jgi:tyrosyl-tRNA synthetase
MFGKVMSIPDVALPQWWELLVGGERPTDDPMEWKLGLARSIVGRWHGDNGARAAEEHFTRVVRRHEAPPDDAIPAAPLPDADLVHVPRVLQDVFGMSTSEGRRLIAQGGVKLDGAALRDLDVPRARLEGAVLQAGKRRFVRFDAA